MAAGDQGPARARQPLEGSGDAEDLEDFALREFDVSIGVGGDEGKAEFEKDLADDGDEH
ncbi:MAG: hypothetical protein Q9Q40_15390 [Acidobacteriota bacterium]|nr:hypothetical protein [Acidobacteriota bacterium]